jgi:hypothetical protein
MTGLALWPGFALWPAFERLTDVPIDRYIIAVEGKDIKDIRILRIFSPIAVNRLRKWLLA